MNPSHAIHCLRLAGYFARMSPQSPKLTGDQPTELLERIPLLPHSKPASLWHIRPERTVRFQAPQPQAQERQARLDRKRRALRENPEGNRKPIAGRGISGQARSLNSCLPAPCSSIIAQARTHPRARREPRSPSDQSRRLFLRLHPCEAACFRYLQGGLQLAATPRSK